MQDKTYFQQIFKSELVHLIGLDVGLKSKISLSEDSISIFISALVLGDPLPTVTIKDQLFVQSNANPKNYASVEVTALMGVPVVRVFIPTYIFHGDFLELDIDTTHIKLGTSSKYPAAPLDYTAGLGQIKFSNNATSRLGAGINADPKDTIIQVDAGTGYLFPTIDDSKGEFFLITIEDEDNLEILEVYKVDPADKDKFFVRREQEGTKSKPFGRGSFVQSRLTAGSITHIENLSRNWADKLNGPVAEGNKLSPPSANGASVYKDPITNKEGWWSARWWSEQAKLLVGKYGQMYLGAFAGDPQPKDVGRTAFEAGQLYYNTALMSMMNYQASTGWHKITTPAAGVLQKYEFVADGVSKRFSGVDIHGNAMTFTTPSENPLSVHVGGVYQSESTATIPADYSIDYTTKIVTFSSVPRKGTVVTVDVLLDPTAKAADLAGKTYSIANTSMLTAIAGVGTTAKMNTYITPNLPNNGAAFFVGIEKDDTKPNSLAGVWVYRGSWQHIIDLSDTSGGGDIHTTTAGAVRGQSVPADLDAGEVLDKKFAVIFPTAKAPKKGDLITIQKGTAADKNYTGTWYYDGANWQPYSASFSTDYIEGFIKAIAADPDADISGKHIPDGSIQAITSVGTRELKIVTAGAWATLFSEEEISAQIAAGAQSQGSVSPNRDYDPAAVYFQGQIVHKGTKWFQCIDANVKGITETSTPEAVNAGTTIDAGVDPDTDVALATPKYWQEIKLAVANAAALPYVSTIQGLPNGVVELDAAVGKYWIFQDHDPYKLTIADGKVFTDLGAITLTSGDWLQVSDATGTSKWNWVNGNFMQRNLWEQYGTFSDTYIVGQGAIKSALIRWRDKPTDAYHWYRARVTMADGTALAKIKPNDTNSNWEDITPQFSPEELAGIDPTANTPIDRGILAYNNAASFWEITDEYQIPLVDWDATTDFIKHQAVVKGSVVYRALAVNTNIDPDLDNTAAVVTWNTGDTSVVGTDYSFGGKFWTAVNAVSTPPVVGGDWTAKTITWQVIAMVRLADLLDTNTTGATDKDLVSYDDASKKYVTVAFKDTVLWDGQSPYKQDDLVLLLGANPAWYVALAAIAAPTNPLAPNPSPSTDLANWSRVGGGTTIGSLTDVDTTTTAPDDQDTLSWSSTHGAWVPTKKDTSGFALYSPAIAYTNGSYVEYADQIYRADGDIPAGLAPDQVIPAPTTITTKAQTATINSAVLSTIAGASSDAAAVGSVRKVDFGLAPYTPVTAGVFAGFVPTEQYYYLTLADKAEVYGVQGWDLRGSNGNQPLPATIDVYPNGLSVNPWTALDKTVIQTLSEIGNVTELTTSQSGNILVADGTGNWAEQPNSSYSKVETDTKIDAVVQGLSHGSAVRSYTSTPPPTPAAFDLYIVKPTGTGVWAGQDNQLAGWDGTQWDFISPKPNAAHLVEDVAETWSWNGTGWVKVASAGGGGGGAAGELFMVGDIKESILTEAQFKNQLTPTEQLKWALADGRDVTGSAYTTLTGQGKIPDLRGTFLRMAGRNNAHNGWDGGNLNSFNEDSTRRPRTNFTGTTSTAGSHAHTVKTTGNEAKSGYIAGGGGAWFPDISSTNAMYPAGNHTHNVTINGGGDGETKPKNYTVNYFIKIN